MGSTGLLYIVYGTMVLSSLVDSAIATPLTHVEEDTRDSISMEDTLTVFGNATVGCFCFVIILSKFLSIRRAGWMQWLIFVIGINLFCQSLLSLFKAYNDLNHRRNRLGYKITSTLYTITMYSTPMLLFYCQVVRCATFILNPTIKKVYFWTTLIAFEVVYLLGFIVVFSSKLYYVFTDKVLEMYAPGSDGFKSITYLRGSVDSLKMINEFIFFTHLAKFFSTKGFSTRRALLPYAIYLMVEAPLLVTTTVMYFRQTLHYQEIYFNNYWMTYTALVLVEMQSFGLDFKKIAGLEPSYESVHRHDRTHFPYDPTTSPTVVTRNHGLQDVERYPTHYDKDSSCMTHLDDPSYRHPFEDLLGSHSVQVSKLSDKRDSLIY